LIPESEIYDHSAGGDELGVKSVKKLKKIGTKTNSD